MDIKQYLLSESKYTLKCPYEMQPIGITVHNTGNTASARNEIAYMISNTESTSFHFAVDENEVIQGIPLNRSSYHAGDGRTGTGNRKTISIEICRSTSSNEALFNKAEENAVKLIVYLLKKYNWTTKDIYTHKHWNGKNCPHKTIEKGWSRFINMVEDKLQEGENNEKVTVKYYDKFPEIPKSYQPTIAKLISKGIIKGDTEGNLHLSEDMCRMLVFMDRLFEGI